MIYKCPQCKREKEGENLVMKICYTCQCEMKLEDLKEGEENEKERNKIIYYKPFIFLGLSYSNVVGH